MKHDFTQMKLDDHKDKVEELSAEQQELIKESGAKNKQHFLLMAIKLKV